MIRVANLTSHPITLVTETASIVVAPSGIIARREKQRRVIGTIQVTDDIFIPITETILGPVISVPEPMPDTVYVVSALVGQMMRDRDDVLIPDNLIRDEHGFVIGCAALARPR